MGQGLQPRGIQGTGPQGHRGRMRGRLVAGPGALADYEIVEMLLFLGVPRRDTKPLAKGLVLRFGGLRETLMAGAEALAGAGVPPRAAEAFRLVAEAAEHLARPEQSEAVLLRDHAAVGRYLDAARPRQPGWSALLLGSRNQLVGDRTCEGASAPAVAGRLLREALGLHATAAILVRGGAGEAAVTAADRALFAQVRDRAGAVSVVLHDLVVVGDGRRWVSLVRPG